MGRRSQGCNACRRRKVACDLPLKSPCTNCLRRGETCKPRDQFDYVFYVAEAEERPSTQHHHVNASFNTSPDHPGVGRITSSKEDWRCRTKDDNTTAKTASLRVPQHLQVDATALASSLLLARDVSIGRVCGLNEACPVFCMVPLFSSVAFSSPAYACLESLATRALSVATKDRSLRQRSLSVHQTALERLRTSLLSSTPNNAIELLMSVMIMIRIDNMDPDGSRSVQMHIAAIQAVFGLLPLQRVRDPALTSFLDATKVVLALLQISQHHRVPFPWEAADFDFDAIPISQQTSRFELARWLSSASYTVAAQHALSQNAPPSGTGSRQMIFREACMQISQGFQHVKELSESLTAHRLRSQASHSPGDTPESKSDRDNISGIIDYVNWHIGLLSLVEAALGCLSEIEASTGHSEQNSGPAPLLRNQLRRTVDNICIAIPLLIGIEKDSFIRTGADIWLGYHQGALFATLVLEWLLRVRNVPDSQRQWFHEKLSDIAERFSIPAAQKLLI